MAPLIKSKKDLASLIVIYDDIDLALGRMPYLLQTARAAGTTALGSIIKSLKTEEFPAYPRGHRASHAYGQVEKKPQGEKAHARFPAERIQGAGTRRTEKNLEESG
ncbi:MAG: hypothetical protein WDN09_02710 [bacterium]